MGYVILALVLLVVGYLVYSKIKQALFVAKDRLLVKEDLALVKKENELKAEISDLKVQIAKPLEAMSPQEIEDYWSKKK